jgi:4,5-DOPA dioxygenase extradiol
MTAETQTRPGRLPAIFLAHGSPFLLDDQAWVSQLHDWAGKLPRPKAVLMISAHWEERPLTIGATETKPLIYDFYGFPERYYQVQYRAPGAPDLAERVKQLVSPVQPVADEPERGLDHGAYVPMVAMYPEADVPVLQVSLPTMDAPTLFDVGRALAPLRDEGVLIVGSGFLTHNLRLMERGPNPETPGWAADFDGWAEDALARRDVDEIVAYRQKAPAVNYALPTHEHFVPVVVAMGAAAESAGPVTFPIEGWLAGSLTKRSVEFH